MAVNYTQTIEIKSGKLRGYFDDDEVMIFKGIPYAEPPIGARRFEPSVLHGGWDGVKDCVEFGNSAPQNAMTEAGSRIWTREFVIRNTDFSEDCLTLNIWTRQGGSRMPVVLYFYGGGYVSGGTSCDIYDGCEFARNGVIYVSCNRREGTLGLFSAKELSEESETGTSGNYMLSDGITALKWIKENIEAFDGDPDNVTIWGQSSGAGQVNALAVSPIARGLFNKVISMGYNNYEDNAFIVPWNTLDQAYENGDRIIKEAGSLEKLKTMPWQEVIKLSGMGCINIDNYYVTGNFKTGVDSGVTDDLPFMMGSVPGDTMMTVMGVFLRGKTLTDCEIADAIRAMFPKTAEDIISYYGLIGTEDLKGCYGRIKDDLLLAGMMKFEEGRMRTGNADKTYVYYFRHPMPGPDKEIYGAFHSCEVPYFLNYFSDLRKDYWQDEDYLLGKKASEQLISFIKTGKPADSNFLPAKGNNYFSIDAGVQENRICSDELKELWYAAFDE